MLQTVLDIVKIPPGGCHSSVVSSLPTILWPQVRIPSTPSLLYQFVLLKLKLDQDENKQKRGREWSIFLKKYPPILLVEEPWSPLDKEESLASQITSPISNKLDCFSNI